MPPRRSSSRGHQPAQRRPRTGRACHFCRITKQRCDPSEYGTTDRPCRRCVSQGLECNIAQAAQSQSPSSGFGAQGFGPVRHRTTPRSAGGATEELTPSPETNVQHALQQSESVHVPMEEWPSSSFMMRQDEQQGSSSSSTVLSPGQTLLQTPDFFPPVPSMGGYPQSFPNVAQGHLESIYYPQDYYGQTTSGNTYMANAILFTQHLISSLTPPNRYAMEEPQPDNEDEEDYSRSDES